MLFAIPGFILERGLAGFPQFGKKCRKKLCCHVKWGATKIDPRISTFFGSKVFETSLQTTTLI